jgi:hypothetical protein
MFLRTFTTCALFLFVILPFSKKLATLVILTARCAGSCLRHRDFTVHRLLLLRSIIFAAFLCFWEQPRETTAINKKVFQMSRHISQQNFA